MGKPKFGKRETHIEPQGRIRASQVVTTFGPGAMVDLLDNAVLVGGLDFWSYDRVHGRNVIAEPRLRDALGPSFKRWYKRELAVDDAFREPPLGDEREPNRFQGVQVLEFPQWFVCQNPSCRALVRSDSLRLERQRYWHDCTRAKHTECVPIRFLGACRKGHCQDIPWAMIAHLGKGDACTGAELALEEGASGDFSQVRVVCRACGAARPLSTLMGGGLELGCDGLRPWLGREGRQECGEKLRLLVRTASNSYFAQVVSALSVPDPGHLLGDAIAEVWDVLVAATPETLPVFLQIPKVKDRLAAYPQDEVLAAIEARRSNAPLPRDPIRTAEFKQFAIAPKETPGELPPDDPRVSFWAREVERPKGLPKAVARVVVAPKLREVRAQIGFTRLEPRTPDLEGEYDLDVEVAPLGLTTNWLPATEIQGEGVLLVLDEEEVRAWEEREAVKKRSDELRAGYVRHMEGAEGAPDFPGARFYLLHSLAHLLISSISLTSGYAASAIRERIYCAPADAALPMAAILLSTGTSGSEGTLGGLVEQARSIVDHLRRAYDLGTLCSNDPVCAHHSPKDDVEDRPLEGSACHGCLFIAECSCERFNRYLDRALVVPTIGHDPALAFFGKRP